MRIWDKIKGKKQQTQKQMSIQKVTMMQSDSLGMTIIQNDQNEDDITLQLSNEEWVDIIQKQSLCGYSFERIYFSFLKGIPQFLRFRIWLILCNKDHFANFKFTSKNEQEYDTKSKTELKQLSLQIYEHLTKSEAKQRQIEQILKDVPRSFANCEQYCYTKGLLLKLLICLSNSGIEYAQGMNCLALNIIIFCLQSLNLKESTFDALQLRHERDMFIIFRETVLRLERVFGGVRIFEVLKVLEQKIAESVPQILYQMCSLGLDCYSVFAQNYYSIMSYNNPPKELCALMIDLFYLAGENAIHAMNVRMLQIACKQIIVIEDVESFQKFIKKDIFHLYYSTFLHQRLTASKIDHFGLSFFDQVHKFKLQ